MLRTLPPSIEDSSDGGRKKKLKTKSITHYAEELIESH